MTRRFRLDRLGDGTPTQDLLAEQVRLASQCRANVLLLGEPGTGKQWLARTIHYQSTARDLAFAVVDCRRLPPAALQAVLLGEGGLLNRADVGAVYFREPALLPRDVQVRLCEVLADPSPTLPRLMAGTSIDLAEEVRANRMVEEWRCALGVLAIEVPPLRKRLTELPWFVEQFLERIGWLPAQETTAGDESRLPTLTPPAWDCLRSYPWPGNLRELFRVLASAHHHGAADRIDLPDLPGYVRTAVRLDQTPGPDAEPSLPLPQLLEQVERRLIQIALQRTRGNKSRAAELLSLPRPRLLRRMAALGIQEP
jgi:DNA-binding NtrC family response regulator